MSGEDDPESRPVIPSDLTEEMSESKVALGSTLPVGGATGAAVGVFIGGPVGVIAGFQIGAQFGTHDGGGEAGVASGCDATEIVLPRRVVETPLRQSQAAYLADLPELLHEYHRKWVAYADGARVKIADTQAELYRHCLKDLALTHDRFVVRRVVPDGCDSEIDTTPY